MNKINPLVKAYADIFRFYAERDCLSQNYETLLVMFKNSLLGQTESSCDCFCHYSGPNDPVGWNAEYHRFSFQPKCDNMDAEECAGRHKNFRDPPKDLP